MTIIVEVKNEILGDSEFWRGDESRIAEIRNIPARMTAEQVVADGKPRVSGMWHVRQELPPNAGIQPRAAGASDGMPCSAGDDGDKPNG
jgi:hypothetical protein